MCAQAAGDPERKIDSIERSGLTKRRLAHREADFPVALDALVMPLNLRRLCQPPTQFRTAVASFEELNRGGISAPDREKIHAHEQQAAIHLRAEPLIGIAIDKIDRYSRSNANPFRLH